MLARCGDIPAYLAPREVLAQLTGFLSDPWDAVRHGPAAAAGPGGTLAGARRIAVLEEVVNPTNVGAIFPQRRGLRGLMRCCSALGAVIPCTAGLSSEYGGRYSRFRGRFCRATPPGPRGPGAAGGLGFQTAAMALTDESLPVFAPQLAGLPKLAIVLGTEGDGLAARTIAGAIIP